MVSAKRQIPPPQRENPKLPRVTSWKNHARSCFAAAPTAAVTTVSYVDWQHDPSHAVMLNLPNIIVAAGALPPHSSTAFHAHRHNTFVLSVIDTPGFMLQNLQPPHYNHHQAHCQSASLNTAACFSQCPFSSKFPFVHRGITTHHPVAFLMIESSAPPLPTLAPTFLVAENPAVSAANRQPSNFWAAAELKIDPGAEATLDSRSSSCPLPLARFICRVQCSLDSLSIQVPQHLKRQTVQTTIGGTFIQTNAVSGFKDSSDTCFRIRNMGQNAWSGVVVDIFGNASP